MGDRVRERGRWRVLATESVRRTRRPAHACLVGGNGELYYAPIDQAKPADHTDLTRQTDGAVVGAPRRAYTGCSEAKIWQIRANLRVCFVRLHVAGCHRRNRFPHLGELFPALIRLHFRRREANLGWVELLASLTLQAERAGARQGHHEHDRRRHGHEQEL